MASTPLTWARNDDKLKHHRGLALLSLFIATVTVILVLARHSSKSLSGDKNRPPSSFSSHSKDGLRMTPQRRRLQQKKQQKQQLLEHAPFAFDAVFGDNMVLQHGSKAAIYGFLGPHCGGVHLEVHNDQDDAVIFSTRQALINATHQPFGEGWGQRPCTEDACPNGVRAGATYTDHDRLAFNPWNQPLATWKVLLPPQPPGGNYTVQVTCLPFQTGIRRGRRVLQKEGTAKLNQHHSLSILEMASLLEPPQGNHTAQQPALQSLQTPRKLQQQDELQDETIFDVQDIIRITNVTFGDVWYCSGQSNMRVALKYTFERNETLQSILQGDYHNIRIMAGNAAQKPYQYGSPRLGDNQYWSSTEYGAVGGTNPWMTARQAVDDQHSERSPLLEFGATCWHFAQHLADLQANDNYNDFIPVGLINTAIGGKRIQEFVPNATLHKCHNRTQAGLSHDKDLWWESQLFASQVLPFADFTIKGWLWYQGENNMHDLKGNSAANVGYGCEMKALIQSWRKLWSQTPGTTPPDAPFGLVTLTRSGSIGGPDIGSMRHAQTANYGVLPPPTNEAQDNDDDAGLPNTFLAQAYDLDDEWIPGVGMGACFKNKCCDFDLMNQRSNQFDPQVCANETLRQLCNRGADPAGGCTVNRDNQLFEGAHHPRNKKEVGNRLAIAAYNLFYGGKEAHTGPTLQGCSVESLNSGTKILEIRFNKTLLRGDSLEARSYPPSMVSNGRASGGSQLYVLTDKSHFCMEGSVVFDRAVEPYSHVCPMWAGGTEEQATIPVPAGQYDAGWIEVDFRLAPGKTNAIHVDLSSLPQGSSSITAVRYAWGLVDCCDHSDPDLYVTHGCIENCPLYSSRGKLPANPFQAKIIDDRCECVAPQVCTDDEDSDFII